MLNRKFKIIMFLVLTLILSVSLLTFAADNETYTIKLAYVAPELTYYQSKDTCYAQTFKPYVESESQGRIKVEIYPAGQLGGERELLESLTLGTIEMVDVSDAVISGFYKKAMVTDTPGVFSSIEEANAVFAGPWGQAWNEELRKALGVKVLNHDCGGFRNFSNNIRELRVPDDVRGLKIRVMESPVYVNMVNSLGAIATPMPASEMYAAMQHGVVDGQENPIANVIDMKVYEVQKYYTLDCHTAESGVWLINDDFFNSLPEDLQKVVLKGANRAGQAKLGLIYVLEGVGLEFLSKYMQIYAPTPEEAELWRNAITSTTHNWVREQIGDEILDGLLDAIKDYREQNK